VIRCFDRRPVYFWQILREVKKINPDVIHLQQELALYGNVITAYLFQWLLLALSKYKLIVTLHGVVPISKITKNFIKENNSNLPVFVVKLAFKVIYRPIAKWADEIIVHETIFKTNLVQEYGAKFEKIKVIPHGVEQLRPVSSLAARKRLGLDPGAHVILFMGYLTGYKGLDLLLEGFAKYLAQDPKAYLIIGSCKHPKLQNDPDYLSEYHRLEDMAKKLIPKTSYRWVGFIDEADIVYYYSASDVSVYPYTISMSSSGPMAIALGYGKPFIASDVFEGVFGQSKILFKRTASSLSEKLKEFFEDPGAFKQGLDTMRESRLWPRVGHQHYEVYLGLK
jgi:glycosyltransferase involved in cell wall biosynthesis